MQGTKRLLVSLGLVASLLSVACAPVFPARSTATVLPIRDPIIGPTPSVLVTLPGRDGPWSAWMYVDSGVPYGAILPSASVARIEPHYADRFVLPILLFQRPVQIGREGLLSSLALGDLLVRDVPVFVTDLDDPLFRPGILGRGILDHAPWEIDWDRGTLTLGATPWPDGPETIVVPLRRSWLQEVVTVEVDGHRVEMILDTGMPLSVIPADTARTAGLSVHEMAPKSSPGGKVTSGDAALGPLRLGHIDFKSVPHDCPGYGLLGLDVLSRYRIQVVPGERLALRPRGDTWQSAPERVARWPWARACRSVGCLRAGIEPAGNDARLVFSFEADLPYPVTLVLGCREVDAVGSRLPSVWERLTSGRNSGPMNHIHLRVPSAMKDHTLEAMVSDGGQWLSRTGCRDISVLDVVPIPLNTIPGGAVHADLRW
jgi:hypothetical protein